MLTNGGVTQSSLYPLQFIARQLHRLGRVVENVMEATQA
jgi:hypothetical protein